MSEDRGGGPGGGGEKGAVAQEKGRLFSSMESTRGGEREQTKTSLAGWMQTGQQLRNDGQLQGFIQQTGKEEKERKKKRRRTRETKERNLRLS